MDKKIEQLFTDLESKGAKQGARAVEALLTISPAYYPQILALVHHPQPYVRTRVCDVLGELGGYDGVKPCLNPIGIPTLLQRLIHDPKAKVRARAAHGIAHQVRPGMIPTLCAAAADPAQNVRRGVCHALGSVLWTDGVARPQLQRARMVFLEFLRDSDAYTREWAAFYVHSERAGLDSPEIRAQLWRLVDDPEDSVRAEACAALGLFGDREIIPYLIRQFESGTVWSWNLEAAEKLGDPAFIPVLRHLRKGYRKTHWFYKSVTDTLTAIKKASSKSARLQGR
jgi:HEAT repeat protein